MVVVAKGRDTPHLMRGHVGVGRDDGTRREVDALAHHILAEEPLLALEHLLDARRLVLRRRARRAALAAVDEARHRLVQLVPGAQQPLVRRHLAPTHAQRRGGGGRRGGVASGALLGRGAELEELRVGGEDLVQPDVLRVLEEAVAHFGGRAEAVGRHLRSGAEP